MVGLDWGMIHRFQLIILVSVSHSCDGQTSGIPNNPSTMFLCRREGSSCTWYIAKINQSQSSSFRNILTHTSKTSGWNWDRSSNCLICSLNQYNESCGISWCWRIFSSTRREHSFPLQTSRRLSIVSWESANLPMILWRLDGYRVSRYVDNIFSRKWRLIVFDMRITSHHPILHALL